MKTRLWLLLAGAAFVLLTSRDVEASGACTAARFHDWNDMGCNQNCASAGAPSNGGCPACDNGGMPRWWVSEPYINLCMADTPLSYTTSSGQQMNFTFNYRQRTKLPDSDEVVGPNFTVINASGATYPTTTAATCGTNACWGNNWNVCLTIWDAQWEQGWRAVPDLPYYDYYPTNYAIFSHGYGAFVLRPEGGVNYYNVASGAQSARDPVSLVTLQAVSSGGVPLVHSSDGNNAPTADSNGIYWGDPNVGVKLVYPDGSQAVFGLSANLVMLSLIHGPSSSPSSGGTSTAQLLLTEKIDSQGRITHLGYEQVYNLGNVVEGVPPQPVSFRVRYVVDPDGRTNQFRYANGATNTFLLAEIDDPYGRNTRLGYNRDGMLTNITDAAGLTNSFQYTPGPLVTNWFPPYGPPYPPVPPYGKVTTGTSSGWITNLSTPYGNTSFSYYEVPDPSVIDGFQQRAIYVSEPEGAHQLYFYQHTNTFMAIYETSPAVLGQADFDDGTPLLLSLA